MNNPNRGGFCGLLSSKGATPSGLICLCLSSGTDKKPRRHPPLPSWSIPCTTGQLKSYLFAVSRFSTSLQQVLKFKAVLFLTTTVLKHHLRTTKQHFRFLQRVSQLRTFPHPALYPPKSAKLVCSPSSITTFIKCSALKEKAVLKRK